MYKSAIELAEITAMVAAVPHTGPKKTLLELATALFGTLTRLQFFRLLRDDADMLVLVFGRAGWKPDGTNAQGFTLYKWTQP